MERLDKATMVSKELRLREMGRVLRILFLALLLECVGANTGWAQEKGQERGKVAVLPFSVHAPKPQDALRTSFQSMLTTQMAALGFKTIIPDAVNRHPLAFGLVLESKDLIRVGADLGADYVIAGSLTQIGNRISIDLSAVDVSQKRPPFPLFMVADSVEGLAETARQVALSIDHQVTGAAQVDSVRVKNNRRIEKEAILAVVRTKQGDRVDPDALDKDLRDIYKMGFFNNVETEIEEGPKGTIVTFVVSEKPSIGKIVFEGNKKMDNDELKKEVGIELYTIFDPNAVKQGVNRLREFYRQKGYYKAQISEKTEPLPNNEVLVKYMIEEDEKVFITKIVFVGNSHYKDKELKKIIETTEKGMFEWFSWFTDWGYLDRKKLEFDVHKLTSYYHNHGFITAKVIEPVVTYDEKQRGLVVTFEIWEGHQYSVNKVSVIGDLIKPADELLKKVQISNEKIFNREIVRNDVLALKDVYADEGYANAEIVPLMKEDDKNFTADITYKVVQGKKVRFERIEISGNDWTRDKVIRRELKVIEGEYFSGKNLKLSTENLYRLGYFDDLEVQTKKGSQDDLMVLDLKVKEKATRSFSVGAGYSSAYAAFVTFQVADNNLFGHGQKLELSARLGGQQTEYNLRFIEPWLFDRRLSLETNLYNWTQEYDDYTRASTGGAITFGIPLVGIDDFTSGSVTYDYDHANISDVEDTASYQIKEMVGTNVTSSMIFGIKRDSKDRPFTPSSGSVNSLTFQYAGGILQGDQSFNKYRARSEWYFPLFWKTVFMARGQAGYVKQRSDGELFVYQKFRIGGLDTVRGYDYASISPIDPVTGDRIGGTKMMCYTGEYRFPVLKEQGIIGLVFFDAGNVFADDESWTFSGIKKSVGAGVRWYSPIGPLRLEYGWKLDPEEGESGGRWEFSVGGLF